MTLRIVALNMECSYAECHYADCCILFIIMLSVILLSVIMLNVVMLSVLAPLKEKKQLCSQEHASSMQNWPLKLDK